MHHATSIDDAPSSTGARLRARLGHWWLRRQGWRVVGQPPTPRRFVLVGAPHTSNWDLPYMLAFGWIYGVRIHWMGKHTLFRPPLGWVMQRLGGIAIDRRSPHGIVEQMAQRFADADELVLAIPPEGTRSRVEYWKSGFYEIAKAAGVPIVLGFLDYGAKEGGIGPSLRPSGDVVRDISYLMSM